MQHLESMIWKNHFFEIDEVFKFLTGELELKIIGINICW